MDQTRRPEIVVQLGPGVAAGGASRLHLDDDDRVVLQHRVVRQARAAANQGVRLIDRVGVDLHGHAVGERLARQPAGADGRGQRLPYPRLEPGVPGPLRRHRHRLPGNQLVPLLARLRVQPGKVALDGHAGQCGHRHGLSPPKPLFMALRDRQGHNPSMPALNGRPIRLYRVRSMACDTLKPRMRSAMSRRGLCRSMPHPSIARSRACEVRVQPADLPLLRRIASILRSGGPPAARLRTRLREEVAAEPQPQPREHLVTFFRRSPLVGLDLKIERDRLTGREIELLPFSMD